ncbi:MAG: helix-turn-helix domain-containing protein [Bilophila wadsworthia]
MSFGKRLKSLLAKKRQSQMDFALRLGITRSRLCNYINDRSEPDYATLCTIASAAGERGLSSWPQRDTGFRFSGKQNLLGLHYRTGKTRFGGDDGLDSLYLSRSETLEEPPVPSGWLRETSSFVQTGEFRQPTPSSSVTTA